MVSQKGPSQSQIITELAGLCVKLMSKIYTKLPAVWYFLL